MSWGFLPPKACRFLYGHTKQECDTQGRYLLGTFWARALHEGGKSRDIQKESSRFMLQGTIFTGLKQTGCLRFCKITFLVSGNGHGCPLGGTGHHLPLFFFNAFSRAKQRQFNFFNVYLVLRERERERESMSRGEAEREGDTEQGAGSRLRAVSTEPDVGLELKNRGIM